MKGRIQHPKYTAVALAAANPVLLDGEIVYESDTGRCKMGDGVLGWLFLPYRADVETVPGLEWKVQDGMLCIKPATDAGNPILKRCRVGILHYKNARNRYEIKANTGERIYRPKNAGFKLVQDKFAAQEITWTAVRINPLPVDTEQLTATGWMRLISVQELFGRWVTTVQDPKFSGGGKFHLHRGSDIGETSCGIDPFGKQKMQVSFYAGVVLFTGEKHYRIEGPRSFFKVIGRNTDGTMAIVHI